DFGQSDAGLGVFYFVWALSAVAGSVVGGVATERFGRRVVLPLAAFVHGLGLAMLGGAPTWVAFLVGAVPAGMGGGALDAGINGLFLDLYPSRRGNVLNGLHLFYSVGALGSPLVIGRLVELGVAWQLVALATGLVAAVVALSLLTVEMPSGRHARGSSAALGGRARLFTLPLVALGAGIAFYVASEIGVSNWVVRFLSDAPLTVATSTLSLFWLGLAAGRLLAARFAHLIGAVAFTATCAALSAVAIVGAVAAPTQPLSIALFGLAGLASGPTYPMIMGIGGSLYPGRSAAVSGFLTASAIAGALVYPPLMGFISVEIGIGAAMIGAGLVAFGCAGAVALTGVLRARAADAA
ncbi:MAG TPA: MFS transporter, partial [Candidatus Limnocylindrales bacterium]